MPTPSRECSSGTSRSGSPSRVAGDVDQALARAVVWRFLALGFAQPSEELRRALTNGPERRALEAALSRLGLPPFPDVGSLDLERRFGDLFGHTLRGKLCAYETEYGGAHIFQQAHELADLQGWYSAFGLERRSENPERADHIGLECEFVGFLAMKEAYAAETESEEQLVRVQQAYRRFLRDHLGRFGIAVAIRLEKSDQRGFYGRLGYLCRTFLANECRRLGVRPGPKTLPLRADVLDGVPAACGMDAECSTCGGPENSPMAGGRPAGDLLPLTRGE